MSEITAGQGVQGHACTQGLRGAYVSDGEAEAEERSTPMRCEV